jgi:hypothetical protein
MAAMCRHRILRALSGLAFALGLALALPASPGHAAAAQQTFRSPERAIDAMVAAARADNAGALLKILGPQAKTLVASGDPVADREGRRRFVAAYDRKHDIERQGEDKAILLIGDSGWPFPIPIVGQGGVWRFDTAAGAQEILARRIGRNELNAIEVCRAYVDAQRDYASQDRNRDGLREYAQKFGSTPGKHDGLYWPAKPGEEASPLGPLVAEAHAEGYGGRGKHAPYQGYYYKILTRQGPHAAGGAHDFVAHGHMIGGFALVAYPAQYGASGVMTFIVNQDGVVHEKNLGPRTVTIARHLTSYDPDSSWRTP